MLPALSPSVAITDAQQAPIGRYRREWGIMRGARKVLDL